MYYNNMKINYLVKNQEGITFGGSDTLEGAEEIMGNQNREYKDYPKTWGKAPVFHIEKANR